MRRTLIALIIIVAAVIGSGLALRNADFSPKSPWYDLKRGGEWLDVNFLVFGAPEKQERHFVLADRRANEFLKYGTGLSEAQRLSLHKRYDVELARAEFMAEHLTLLDRKFQDRIEDFYWTSLRHIEEFQGSPDGGTAGPFLQSARSYNAKAIKTLIQKHWYTEADFERYKTMVAKSISIAESAPAGSDAVRQKIAEARHILDTSRQIEWAYDTANGQ